MKTPEEMKSFLQELQKYWEKVPEYNFDKFFVDVVSTSQSDPYYLDDNQLLNVFREYFSKDKE